MTYNKKEIVIDVIRDFIFWIVVTALSFVWWLLMLLIFSIILMNVWHTSFEAILKYSIVLMILTSVAYLVAVIHRRFRVKKN